MTLVDCPTCLGQGSFLCDCQGEGCELCQGEGSRACDTCGRFGAVEEPLHCPSCGRQHGGPLRGWGLDEMHKLRRVKCAECVKIDVRRGVPAANSSECDPGVAESTAPGSTPKRRDSVRRRWDKDKKPCGRCGADVLWRKEDSRRVPLNENATEHACPS